MPIPSKNSDAALLLLELDTQCMLISMSFDYLKPAADHWVKLCNGIDDGKRFPPIEIIAQCTICLAGMTAIRNLLFECGRKSQVIRKRCLALRKLLGYPDLPILSSALVRNSWEHLDERLDDLLPSSRECSISPIQVAPGGPAPNEVFIKRFSPDDLSIWFLTQKISLADCEKEVALVSERIKSAFTILSSEHHEIYSA